MTDKERLLIVDDEPDMLEGLSRLLSLELDPVDIRVTPNPLEAIAWVRQQRFAVALLDIRMPEMDGLDVLAAMRDADPWLTIVMMTAYGSIETAVEAIKGGAYDFITKPFDRGALLRTLKKAFERNRLLRENLNLRKRVRRQDAFESLVGQSLPMRRLYEQVRTIARTDYTVLIRGESGTGKELVARAIHKLSRRAERPMVTVNCPAIPEHLLETELFGHKRGAFTGAERDHRGLLREAEGGTLFLDEIGDISTNVQTKLLRVLQEGEIRPLGGSRTEKVDVRVLASTNRDLEKKLEEKTFREDLFYRLNVVTVWTPSLERIREDIPVLVRHFIRLACEEVGSPEKRISLEALNLLMGRSWPGNVRELRNAVRRVVMFCPEDEIRPEHLRLADGGAVPPGPEARPGPSRTIEPYKDAKQRAVEQFTRRYLERLMVATSGNVTRAAEVSGLTRSALQKIMRRLGIHSRDFRSPAA